jgi:hypothetical protein
VAAHCDAWGYTPLHLAAQHGHLAVVRELLRAGAAVDARACGATPLHRACYSGHLAVAEELVRAGASLRTPDTTGAGREDLPVHKAARQGHRATVELLLALEPALAHARNADRDLCADLLARAEALAAQENGAGEHADARAAAAQERGPGEHAEPCRGRDASRERGGEDDPGASGGENEPGASGGENAPPGASSTKNETAPEAAIRPEPTQGAAAREAGPGPAQVQAAATPRLGCDCPLCGHRVVRMSRLPCCGRLACRPCFLARRASQPCALCT